MQDLNNIGKKSGTIEVVISYRIIELFSGGLYSSPNKAFEELVTNAYDADASSVGVGVPLDIRNEDHLWVLDNGSGMDSGGLEDLWRIGESNKRNSQNKSSRTQVGKFGIGKLSTFILANRLTYITKKAGKFRAVTMDYSRLDTTSNQPEAMKLSERTLNAREARSIIEPYTISHGTNMGPFELFGKNAAKSWTFSLMTVLKPRATEIQSGRLKWILRTALPLNPGFKLYLVAQSLNLPRSTQKSKIGGSSGSQTRSLNRTRIIRSGGKMAKKVSRYQTLGVFGARWCCTRIRW